MNSQSLTGSLAALFCLDLDGFKQVNDTLGHHAGDCLLQAVARRLEFLTRPDDAVFRLGGDEFVMLIQDLPTEAAGSLANQVIEQLTSQPYEIDGLPPIRIGVSIGLACAPEDGLGIEDLHHKADSALYASKAAGRGVYRRFEMQMAAE